MHVFLVLLLTVIGPVSNPKAEAQPARSPLRNDVS